MKLFTYLTNYLEANCLRKSKNCIKILGDLGTHIPRLAKVGDPLRLSPDCSKTLKKKKTYG